MKCPNKTTQERMVYSRSCQNAQMSNIPAPELHQGSNQLPGHSFSSCLLLHWGRNSSSVSYLRCHWHWPRTSTFLSSALVVSWCDCFPHLKQWAGHCPYLPSFTSCRIQILVPSLWRHKRQRDQLRLVAQVPGLLSRIWWVHVLKYR